MSSVSGLSAQHRAKARSLAMQAAHLGYRNNPQIHYTQDLVKRWEGIRQNKKAFKHQYPNFADCSSFATWCIWNGLYHFGVRDTVNGLGWKAGFTGTMLKHGKLVRSKRNWRRGDCFIYGHGWPGTHTAIYIGGGYVISHGSEGGPYKVKWNYRSDLIEVRRYI